MVPVKLETNDDGDLELDRVIGNCKSQGNKGEKKKNMEPSKAVEGKQETRQGRDSKNMEKGKREAIS